ncbi:MAG TPA: DUF3488 and transglutaminase-like domain-containing protein [Terriglobales bacterium]|nr:DUF3488 and transglutaminase-like domain-containing protein [Terriglobales bacterium]
MGPPLRRYFEGLLLLLLATGFGALAITGDLPWLVMAPAGAAFALRGYLFWRGLEARIPVRWTVTALLLYLPVYVLDGMVLSGDFVAATLHLVVLAGAAQMFSATTNRDYITLGLLALLEVLAAALLTVSGAFFLLFLVFLAVLIATLVVHEMMQSQRVGGAPETVNRRAPLRPLLRFSLLLSVGVAGFSIVIFFLLPRLTTGAWAARPQNGLSGFSDEVQLGAVASLQRSNTPVMHIRVTSPGPGFDATAFQQIPWRGRGLTRFDGQRWYAPDSPTLYRTDAGQLQVGMPPPRQASAQIVHYSVTLEPIGSPVLFFPAQLLRVDTRFPVLAWDRTTDTLSSLGQGFSGVSYAGISDVAPPDIQTLRTAPPVNPERLRGVLGEDLQLPDSLDPRIPALARTITAHTAPDTWDRMQALSQYLQTHYQYTLQELPQGPDPLATFLFDQPQGDCEYFASALAVMARSLSIPTRVVNGFVLGDYNALTGEYIVRGSDAHAWVEAYFPAPASFRRFKRGGWVAFDATPASGTAASSLFPEASMVMDALSSVWQEWIVNYDWVHQVHLARLLQGGLGDSTGQVWTNATGAVASAAAAIWQAGAGQRDAGLGAGAAVLFLVLIGGIAYRRGWRPRWSRAGRVANGELETQRLARQAYRRFQRYLRRAGFRRLPAETAHELAAAVAEGEPGSPLAEHSAAFVQTYHTLRFGPGDATLAAHLRQELAKVRQALGWRAYLAIGVRRQ